MGEGKKEKGKGNMPVMARIIHVAGIIGMTNMPVTHSAQQRNGYDNAELR
jgi:hypothetical protein